MVSFKPYSFKPYIVPLMFSTVIIGCGGGSSDNTSVAGNTPASSVDTSSSSIDTISIATSSVAISSSSAPSSLAGTVKPVELEGAIDGFGSVIVNGIHYETDNATIYVDGEVSDEGALSVGYVVNIEGTVDEEGNGIAIKIDYHSAVTGNVQSIDIEAQSLIVNGQTINFNNDTLFDDAVNQITLDEIKIGSAIKISGHITTSGGVIATVIELEDAMTQSRLSGHAYDINFNDSTFFIGQQLVDFSNATLIFPEGINQLMEGDRVRLSGILEQNSLVAEGDITVLSQTITSDIPKNIEVTGILNAVDGKYFLNGYDLTFDNASFINGEQSDLLNESLVTIKGIISTDSEGAIKVDNIIFNIESNIRQLGLIDSIEVQASTITMNEQVFNITKDTDFIERNFNNDRYFDFSDLSVGDTIVLNAYEKSDELFVKSIERTEQNITTPGSFQTGLKSFTDEYLVTTDNIQITLSDETKLYLGDELANSLADLGQVGEKDSLLIIGYYSGIEEFIAVRIIVQTQSASPGGNIPVDEQPIEEQPVEEQPVEEQPVEEQPVKEQPVEEQPEEGTDEDSNGGSEPQEPIAPPSRKLVHIVESIDAQAKTFKLFQFNKTIQFNFSEIQLNKALEIGDIVEIEFTTIPEDTNASINTLKIISLKVMNEMVFDGYLAIGNLQLLKLDSEYLTFTRAPESFKFKLSPDTEYIGITYNELVTVVENADDNSLLSSMVQVNTSYTKQEGFVINSFIWQDGFIKAEGVVESIGSLNSDKDAEIVVSGKTFTINQDAKFRNLYNFELEDFSFDTLEKDMEVEVTYWETPEGIVRALRFIRTCINGAQRVRLGSFKQECVK